MGLKTFITNGQANGVTMTAGNIDSKAIGVVNGTAVFSTASPPSDASSFLRTTPSGNGTQYATDDITATALVGRVRFRLSAIPTAEVRMIFVGVGGTLAGAVGVVPVTASGAGGTTSAYVRLRDSAGVNAWTSAALPLNAWMFADLLINRNGQLQAVVYTATGALFGDSTLLTGQNVGANDFTIIREGRASTTADTSVIDFATMVYDPARTTRLPAPFSAAVEIDPLAGDVPVYEQFTLNAQTTGTVTWTRRSGNASFTVNGNQLVGRFAPSLTITPSVFRATNGGNYAEITVTPKPATEAYFTGAGVGVGSFMALFGDASPAPPVQPVVTAGSYYRAPQQVDTFVAQNPELAVIRDQPQGLWLGIEWAAEPAANLQSMVAAAAGKRLIVVAYSIPGRDQQNYSAGGADNEAQYVAWIDKVATGIGTAKADIILEPDAIPLSQSNTQAQKDERNRMLRNAAARLRQNGNARVYADLGHPGWMNPQTAADYFNAVGFATGVGFSLNVSNYRAQADCIAWANQVSALTGGAHYVIDTSRNGVGNNPSDFANAPGQGLGKKPTAVTGEAACDAFLWIKAPGESDSPINGGRANGGLDVGDFYLSYAQGLLSRANFDGTGPSQSSGYVDLSTVVQSTDPTYLGICSSTYGNIPVAGNAQAAAEQALDARSVRIPVRWNGTKVVSSAGGSTFGNILELVTLYKSWGYRVLVVVGGRTNDFDGYVNGDAAAIKGVLGTDGIDYSSANEPDNSGKSAAEILARGIQIQSEIAPTKLWGWVAASYKRNELKQWAIDMGVNRFAGIDYHHYGMGGSWVSTAQAFAETPSFGTEIGQLRADLAAAGLPQNVDVDEANYSWRWVDGTPDAEGGSYGRTRDWDQEMGQRNMRFFTAINTVWQASALLHTLRAGGRVKPYATQNGPLGVMVEANPSVQNPDNRAASSPLPAYWGVAAITGGGAPGAARMFSHYKDAFYRATSSDPLTEVFVVNNEAGGFNVMVLNKRENASQRVRVDIPGAGTFRQFLTRKSNPYDAPVATAAQPYSGSITVNMGACSVVTLVLTPTTVS